MIPRALPAPKGKGLLTGLLASLGIGALAVGGGITRNPALLLAMVCTGAACMAMVLRGRPSLGAVLVFLCGAGFLKRALFAFGPVSREEYFLAILLPDVVLGVAGLAALRGWKGRVAPADGMVVLFFLFCASQVLNPHVSPSTGAAGFKLTGMSVVAYVLGRSTGRDPGEVDRLEEWILVIASVAAVAGIISFVSGPTGFERSWMLSGQTALTELHRQGGAGYRVMSFFESHEQLGFFLGLAIMVVASRDRMRPGARLALVVLFLTTLFLTYSRSSWIALGVGGGCILIHRLRGRGPVRLAIVLPAAGLIGAAVFGTWLASLSVGTDHPLLEKALQTGTFSARVEGWRQFWVDPRYGTLLGNGIGSL